MYHEQDIIAARATPEGSDVVVRSVTPECFLFVIWEKARKQETQLRKAISSRFKVIREFEVTWPRRYFTANLAAFYGWKDWFCWWNKARKCGRGPFLVIEVVDPSPNWIRGGDTSGHDLLLNANVRDLKSSLRAMTGHSNRVHGSLTREETAHELAAFAAIDSNGLIPFKAMAYRTLREIGNLSVDAIERLLSGNALERIGMGARRACYRLPDGRRCLKCYRSDAEIAEGKHAGQPPFKPLAPAVIREIHNYRFSEKRNTCCQEYRYWLALKKRLPTNLMAAFPATLELVSLPSRGWALVEELVVNADGSPVRKFGEEWAAVEAAERPVLFSAFKSLSEDLIRHAVRFYDPQNILVQRLADGAFRLRITDFEPASRLLVPIDEIPAIARLKVRRRFARYLVNWGISPARKHPLPKRLRRKWDEIIATEGAKLGLANCRAFLENKIVNDIFYEGTFNGRSCIVKCSSKASDSIANEYEMLRRVHAADAAVFPEPFVLWTSSDGRMAFIAMEKIGGGTATNPAADILRMAEALRSTGIVHRDISVCNLLCGADGHLKLIDFQFAIDRNDYHESAFMRRNPKYLYVHFGNCESLGPGKWNDILGLGLAECLKHFAPDDMDSIRKLLGMADGMTFKASVGRYVMFRIWLYSLSLCIQFRFSRKWSVKWRLHKIRKLRGLEDPNECRGAA